MSPKVNVFCAISRRRVFGPFFFAETVTGKVYLDMMENWLTPQLADEEVQGYIYQQDGAPPHWHKEFREYLNEHLPGRRVGRAGARQHLHLATPVTKPDSVRFLPVGFRQGQCLRPTTSKDTTRIARAHQHRNRERHTRHA